MALGNRFDKIPYFVVILQEGISRIQRERGHDEGLIYSVRKWFLNNNAVNLGLAQMEPNEKQRGQFASLGVFLEMSPFVNILCHSVVLYVEPLMYVIQATPPNITPLGKERQQKTICCWFSPRCDTFIAQTRGPRIERLFPSVCVGHGHCAYTSF